jgi:hypothetical protein
MNFIKLILAFAAFVIVAMLAFSVLGFLYSTLWTIFWLGVVAIGAIAGYKIFFEKDKPRLESKDPVSRIEYDAAASQKQLEEYKRKYLPK